MFFQAPDGILYNFDEGRSKWLSVNRETMTFSVNAKKISGKRYMALNGIFYSNSSGKKLLRDAVITTIGVQTGNFQCTFDINIHKNNSDNIIYSVSLLNEPSKIIENINFDLNKNDYIQVSLDNSDVVNVSYPEIIIEYCWRTTY